MSSSIEETMIWMIRVGISLWNIRVTHLGTVPLRTFQLLVGESIDVYVSSTQLVPLPTMPSGQGPHEMPSTVSVHFTPGGQGLGTHEGRGGVPPIATQTQHQGGVQGRVCEGKRSVFFPSGASLFF